MTSVMDRRTFLGVIAGGLLATPLAAEAQPAGKIFRIGVLGLGSSELLRQTLREVGYLEGLNLAIEWRDPEGKTERFGDLASELVRLKVDVIVAINPAATFAAKRSTASIPIVMVTSGSSSRRPPCSPAVPGTLTATGSLTWRF
jgi:putative ABC transport system substrate-binding protein